MAPSKYVIGAAITTKSTLMPLARKGISTRSQNIQDQNTAPVSSRGKRKAEASPLKNDKVKRSALGNLTNSVLNPLLDDKKNVLTKQDATSKKTATKTFEPIKPPPKKQDLASNKILTRAAAKNATTALLPPPVPPKHGKTSVVVSTTATTTITTTANTITTNLIKKENVDTKSTTRRISNEFEKTEDSLYMSALEDLTVSDSIRFSDHFDSRRSLASISSAEVRSRHESRLSITAEKTAGNRIASPCPLEYPEIPGDIANFDKENWNDPFQVSHYAMDIFEYLKQREALFPISDYMLKQDSLSKWMRSLLVDWMVEVQETFELNHETLYLGVKLVDLFLMNTIITKDKLQLLGATSLFIACKYDERTPPLVEDFLYICDGAYTHSELIKMEMNVLKTINFDLGIPLSYRFLRRYARCARVQMPTLTLARYILELSLMDYSMIFFCDSQIAAAALFIAMQMNGAEKAWSKTLEYYSGYKLTDFAYIVPSLNSGLHRKPRESIQTIRNKYSHKIFHQVATIPPLPLDKLFENTELCEKTTTV